MKSIRWSLLAILLVLFASFGLAQTRTNYSGVYSIAGKNPDGSAYTGSMAISQYGDGYRVTATYGSDTWRGIATDIGDYLSVAFLAGDTSIISIYKISGSNTLEGFWQSTAGEKEGAEVATLSARNFDQAPKPATTAKRLDFSGNYKIAGKNPDGSTYAATMTLVPFGDGYKASISSGNNTWTGIATDIANYLSVSIKAGNIPSVNIYELKSDGSLIGFWQDYNNQKEGQEVLSR